MILPAALTRARDDLRAALRATPDLPVEVRREVVELCARMVLLKTRLTPRCDLEVMLKAYEGEMDA